MLNFKFKNLFVFLIVVIIGCERKDNDNIIKSVNKTETSIDKPHKHNITTSNNNFVQLKIGIFKNSLNSNNNANVNLITKKTKIFSSRLDNVNDDLSELAIVKVTDNDIAQNIAMKLIDKYSEKELVDFAKLCSRNNNNLLEYILLSNLISKVKNQKLKEKCLLYLILSSSDINRYNENIYWAKQILNNYSEKSRLYTPAILKMADSSDKIGDYRTAIKYYNIELQRMYLPATAIPLAELYNKIGEKEKAINVVNKAIKAGNPSPFEKYLLFQLSNNINYTPP